MKELFRLKSFKIILFWLLLFGILIGAIFARYQDSPTNFKLTGVLIPFIIPLFYIFRGIRKNANLFIDDTKSLKDSNY